MQHTVTYSSVHVHVHVNAHPSKLSTCRVFKDAILAVCGNNCMHVHLHGTCINEWRVCTFFFLPLLRSVSLSAVLKHSEMNSCTFWHSTVVLFPLGFNKSWRIREDGEKRGEERGERVEVKFSTHSVIFSYTHTHANWDTVKSADLDVSLREGCGWGGELEAGQEGLDLLDRAGY